MDLFYHKQCRCLPILKAISIAQDFATSPRLKHGGFARLSGKDSDRLVINALDACLEYLEAQIPDPDALPYVIPRIIQGYIALAIATQQPIEAICLQRIESRVPPNLFPDDLVINPWVVACNVMQEVFDPTIVFAVTVTKRSEDHWQLTISGGPSPAILEFEGDDTIANAARQIVAHTITYKTRHEATLHPSNFNR